MAINIILVGCFTLRAKTYGKNMYLVYDLQVAEEIRSSNSDSTKCIILRCYEAYGGSWETNIYVKLPNNILSVTE